MFIKLPWQVAASLLVRALFFSGNRMMKAGFVFIGLFLLTFDLWSQHTDPHRNKVEQAYESFKQEFREEFGGEFLEVENGDTTTLISFKKAVTLPGWMFSKNPDHQKTYTVIAMSDPGLDSALALEQARIRALALIVLENRSSIQNISDNYYLDRSGERTLGKFNSFTNIAAAAVLNSDQFRVVSVEYTSNNEAILMASLPADAINNPEACDTIRCSLELFQSETGKTNKASLVSRLIFNIDYTGCDSVQKHAHWQLNESSGSLEVISELNKNQLQIPRAKYKYISDRLVDSLQQIQEPDQPIAFELKYGLWYGYIRGIASQLEHLDVFNLQVKNMDDDFYRLYQDLTRVISSQDLSFRITSISVSENRILLNIIKRNP